MNRKIYLEDIPFEDAKSAFSGSLAAAGLWEPLPPEIVNVAQARGRVTASPTWAKISAPHYHASAMDGFALRSHDSKEATETNPIQFTLIESDQEERETHRPAIMINTGQPIPLWADCVVMVEHAQPIQDPGGNPAIEIYASLPPWHHVRPMGEDMVASELVIPANHRLRPVDLGALAAAGHTTVDVYRKPVVAIIPTGSELISINQLGQRQPEPGQIIEFNSIVLAAQIEDWGGRAVRWPIVADEFEKISGAVTQAAIGSDLVLVNAGSSAGSEDYTASVVESLGELLVHGVAVRPGHPVILGLINVSGMSKIAPENRPGPDVVPVIGVPGYPVSAALTGELFIEPLLAKWQGQSPREAPTLTARITRKVPSHTGDDDFVRVTVGRVNEKVMATPLSRGAGVISSLVRADGLIRIPRFSEGLDAGSEIDVHLYRSPREIDRTIVVIGSHDLTLDLMAQHLAQAGTGQRLTSANVGSLGGLVALKRHEAHLAGSHLLDQATGRYNDAFVRRYLPGREVVLVTLVGREQGWIVPPGNPKRLTGWKDAANPDITIVNRQRGAGTRELLDYELQKENIPSADVNGYSREEYTHLAVAAAVASGTADAGLGISAAARALACDFVPLTYEHYELVIPIENYESDLLQPLLQLLDDGHFRKDVQSMPGYNIEPMGDIRHVTFSEK
jgi:putative molybdopterin biosynthesis protein